MENDTLSKRDRAILLAAEKGYKIVGLNQILGPNNKIRKLRETNFGYYTFSVCVNYNQVTKKSDIVNICVHRFVAYLKFGGKIFNKALVVRHLDGDPKNNSFENIEIGTQSQNMMDINAGNRMKNAIFATSKNRKFTDLQMEQIRNEKRSGATYGQLMEKWTISSKGTLYYILNNEYKSKA